jgi:uncharacterized protein (TIGR02265 family)
MHLPPAAVPDIQVEGEDKARRRNEGEDEPRRMTAPAIPALMGRRSLAPTSGATNHCRGVCLTAVLDAARMKAWDAFLVELWKHDRHLHAVAEGDGIKGLGWYPIDYLCVMNLALRNALGGGLEVARDVGRASTKRDLTRGPFRALLKIASPTFLIERAPSLFRAYLERGNLEVATMAEQQLELRFTQCVGFDAAIFAGLAGGCEGALEAAGANQVGVHALEGGRDGDEHLVLAASWA